MGRDLDAANGVVAGDRDVTAGSDTWRGCCNSPERWRPIRTPIAYAGGIVNAASGVSVVAPGAIIRDLRSYFGATTSVFYAYPFQRCWAERKFCWAQGTAVVFHQQRQILRSCSYDIAPIRRSSDRANRDGSSQPQTVAVGAAQPGVFTQNRVAAERARFLGQKPVAAVFPL